MSAYLMVSLHSQVLNNHPEQGVNKPTDPVVAKFPDMIGGTRVRGGKLLNNLRLVIQLLSLYLLKPWRVGFSSFTLLWISNTTALMIECEVLFQIPPNLKISYFPLLRVMEEHYRSIFIFLYLYETTCLPASGEGWGWGIRE
jgi:hypothetical protein